MRKIIIAATTVATLAAPAVSMAANSHVATSRVEHAVHRQSTYDGTRPLVDTCSSATACTRSKSARPRPSQLRARQVPLQDHEADHGGTGQARRCSSPPVSTTINWLTTYGGWNSDFNGASATSMSAHVNANGSGFSAVATTSSARSSETLGRLLGWEGRLSGRPCQAGSSPSSNRKEPHENQHL